MDNMMMLDDCRLMHGLRVKCPMVDHGSEIEGGRHDDKSERIAARIPTAVGEGDRDRRR
jgi:hypothetical protein